MDGRWPVFGSAAVLLDMDTLPEPFAFYQAWTRRLMNDKSKPDTLDAIAREMRDVSERVYSEGCVRPSADLDALIARLTALSNQGEGAVVGWAQTWRKPGKFVTVAHIGDQPQPFPPELGMTLVSERPLTYLHPAEADSRDTQRLDWLAFHGAAMRNDDGMEGGGWFVLAPYHTGIASVDGRTRFKTVREAIDAATQEQT